MTKKSIAYDFKYELLTNFTQLYKVAYSPYGL